MNVENKKWKIIAASIVWVLILWSVWFFWYQKFMKKPIQETTQVENNVEENTENQEEIVEETTITDEFDEERKEIIDWLTMNYLTTFNTVKKWIEWFDVVNENIKITNKNLKKFWLNSNLSLEINTVHNINDVESLVETEEENTKELDEWTDETEWETENEWNEDETSTKKEKKIDIKNEEDVEKWKVSWTYNWIKWDFDWKINLWIKFINKNVDKKKSEKTNISFVSKFSWNSEQEIFTPEKFNLKTNIWELEELSRLDDYLVKNKFLNLETWKTWLLMKNVSFIQLSQSINELIEWMKENKVFNLSKEPITQNLEPENTDTEEESNNVEENKEEESDKTEENTEENNEDWVEKVEQKQLQSSWESKDELDQILSDKKEENTEENNTKDENTKESNETNTTESNEETNEENDETDTLEVEKTEDVEEIKYYVSLNNEWFKTIFKEKYNDLKLILELFWQSIIDISEEDFNNAKLDWEIIKKWSDIEFKINSFNLWKLEITWSISNSQTMILINWINVNISLNDDWMNIEINNTNEHSRKKITLKSIKEKVWLMIKFVSESWKWVEKKKNILNIQTLFEKWNEKLPALFQSSEDSKPQIKVNKIFTEYNTILQKKSKEFINEWKLTLKNKKSKNQNKKQ